LVDEGLVLLVVEVDLPVDLVDEDRRQGFLADEDRLLADLVGEDRRPVPLETHRVDTEAHPVALLEVLDEEHHLTATAPRVNMDLGSSLACLVVNPLAIEVR
jgi:hypothetical protein